ncbi:MAG: single-strand DNA-binding protein [Solirubrobacteraceae bacterium]|jgi:single-strand DNA-binding protein|nr:single-strand DNA-binding protein [Solirubrobacteraceae bacterium]
MAIDINRYVCTGYLTKDVTLRETKSETQVANMGVAVNRGQRDGEDLPPIFWEVACFGKTAENCARFLKKGSPVAIDARVEPDAWQAQDGSKRVQFKLIAQSVRFLGQAPNNGATDQEHSSAPEAGAEGDDSVESKGKGNGGRSRSRKAQEPAGATA